MPDEDARVGEDRCWPCTLANGLAGFLVAVPPLIVAWVQGDPTLVAGAVAWAGLVLAFTLHRLLRRGYLPGAGRMAKRTGLHDRIGPGGHGGEGGDGSEAGPGGRPGAEGATGGDDRDGGDRARE